MEIVCKFLLKTESALFKLRHLKLFFCSSVRVQRRFQQFFSHITTVSGCDRELNAHFYSAASMKYHAPATLT